MVLTPEEKGTASMIDINIGNFVTVGLIAVLFYALLMWGAKLLGVNLSWLQQ